MDDANFVVKLLFQAGFGSIRELAENYFNGPELHNKALKLLSEPALKSSEGKLFSACSDLNPELAELLLELITLADEDSGHLKFNILKRVNPEIYELCKKGFMTKNEKDCHVFWAMEELLEPVLNRECKFHIREIDGFWIEHRNLPIQKKDIQIIHCSQLAGVCSALAYTGMHALSKVVSKGLADQKKEFNTIFLLDEMIEIAADIVAFYPVKQKKDYFHSDVLDVLNNELSYKPSDRADLFQRWSEQFSLWHEEGHLRSDAHIAKLLEEKPELKHLFIFDNCAMQLYADAYVLSQDEIKDNDLMRQFLLVQNLDRGWQNNDSGLTTEELEKKSHYLFVVRALMEKNPCIYLYDLLKEMEDTFVCQGVKAYKRWLRRKIKGIKKDVFADLTKRASL